MGKMCSRFQTKTAQKPYPMGTYLYGLYEGDSPPPPPPARFSGKKMKTASRKHLIPPLTLKQKTNWKYLK